VKLFLAIACAAYLGSEVTPRVDICHPRRTQVHQRLRARHLRISARGR